jgi:hypothetical protein
MICRSPLGTKITPGLPHFSGAVWADSPTEVGQAGEARTESDRSSSKPDRWIVIDSEEKSSPVLGCNSTAKPKFMGWECGRKSLVLTLMSPLSLGYRY